MPSVSRKQQRAMFAAAAGHSTLDIPQSVGKDFAQADIARGPVKLPARVPGLTKARPSQRGIPKRRGVMKTHHPGDQDALPAMHSSKHH